MRTFADIVDIVVNSTKVSFGQVLQVLFLAVAAIFFLATVEFLTGLLNGIQAEARGARATDKRARRNAALTARRSSGRRTTTTGAR